MKFQSEHYETLKKCIGAAIQGTGKTIAELKEKSKELNESETRFLWNLFWASKWSQLHREQYNEGDYMDSHIQTALKNVVKDLLV